MTDQKRAFIECAMFDCKRLANGRTGRCDLHDAIVMVDEANDLLEKTLKALDRIVLKDREVEHCESPNGNPQSSPEAGTSGEGLCPNGLSERLTENNHD
jgi:hypothetical protein